MLNKRRGAKAGRDARIMAEMAQMDTSALDEALRKRAAARTGRKKTEGNGMEEKRLCGGIDVDLPDDLRPVSTARMVSLNKDTMALLKRTLDAVDARFFAQDLDLARARKNAGAMFFGVFLALGVTVVLLAAVLFELAALHGKVDGPRAASAAPSPTLSMEDGSKWDFRPASRPLPPAPPEFPPVILKKNVVVEKTVNTAAGFDEVPAPPLWCGLAVELGFDPSVCREIDAPEISPAEPALPAVEVSPGMEAGRPPAVGLPRVMIEKAPDNTPPESVP